MVRYGIMSEGGVCPAYFVPGCDGMGVGAISGIVPPPPSEPSASVEPAQLSCRALVTANPCSKKEVSFLGGKKTLRAQKGQNLVFEFCNDVT